MWLKIEASVNSELKVTWGGRSGNYPLSYCIGAEVLRRQAAIIRTRLAELADCLEENDDALRRRCLVELATAGSGLRGLLFSAQVRRVEIRELEQWIAEEYQAGDNQLAIQADSSIHVPWGLIYDGKLPNLTTEIESTRETHTGPDHVRAAEIEEFAGFWCLKYNASAHAGYMGARSRMSRRRAAFGLLSLVNTDVLDDIKDSLHPDAYRLFEKWLQPPIGMARCLSECQELIDQSQCEDILFYYLGHHKNAALELGGGKNMDYAEFIQLIDALADHGASRGATGCGLLFLNACESAVGDQDVSLRRAAMRPELCGVIATESVVPRNYAARFGQRFMELLVEQGNTVSQVLHSMRRDSALWPESLVYGCYAHPDYRICNP